MDDKKIFKSTLYKRENINPTAVSYIKQQQEIPRRFPCEGKVKKIQLHKPVLLFIGLLFLCLVQYQALFDN